ncbi:NAD(P)-dependent oxidoreductase [Haliea sp. AH-315-K21]|uniref:2-hydroxy-3-oxopropionate reductase n=1 Tax=SAR86 cluster bacterium TaxID=2030880 RepID=A0A2A5C9Q8_9GAMM|nr:NAD(P)-dependent oxidoreductase [Haliea sp. AH-315-K21]PCJ40180.1 MAG: 2-hydroxy-3-oxopropionate reductase [SAR86 cluster bacterium]
MSDKPVVGFVGIGNMGWPMAANVLKAGFALKVFDTSPEQVGKFVAEHEGAVGAKSMSDIAACELVVTMLPTGQIVREALLEVESSAFISHAKSGTVVIDMSSSEPTGTQELGAELVKKGVTLIDAPVSGGVAKAISGALTIMIGGDDAAAIEKSKAVLATMGERLFETGALGNGHAVKALNNYVAATAFAASSEAILIAKRFGLDPHTLVDIMNVSTGKSFHTEVVLKDHVIDEKYATGFQLGLLAKDVKIAADLGKAVGLDAPVSRLISQRWADALETVGFTADNTEAIKGWDKSL